MCTHQNFRANNNELRKEQVEQETLKLKTEIEKRNNTKIKIIACYMLIRVVTRLTLVIATNI